MRLKVLSGVLVGFILTLLYSVDGLHVNAFAASPPIKGVEFVGNHDGDTFNVNIQGLPPVFGHKVPVRVRHIDTAELNARGYCERAMARLAKDRVYHLLSKAKQIDLENVSRGSFFRLLADVIITTDKNTTISLSDHLLKVGYAAPYKGGGKPKTNWCLYRKKLLQNK